MQLLNGSVITNYALVIFLIILAIAFFVLFILNIRSSYEKNLETEKAKNAQLLKQEVERIMRIFGAAGIGLLVYRNDGKLQFSDKKMSSLLDDYELPTTLEHFLSKYGEENGLKTAYFLGNSSSEGLLTVDNKIIKLRYSKFSQKVNNDKQTDVNPSNSPSSKDEGIVVFGQDISREMEEDDQRKKFVANVSHELKTPITVMKIYAETLLDWGLDEKKPESVKKDLQHILDNANRMESLVNDLLLLSKIDSKGRTLNIEECNLIQVMHEVIEQCKFQADEKNIDIEFVTVSKIPPVLADRNSLSRIFSNLILNAIKYNDERGTVEVYLSRVINDIVIKVKDNGLGIDPRYQKNIFDRFYRVDQTGSRQHGGTGLGLSIAKELVDLLHGKITVNSALTSGSEFVVTLPIAAKFYTQIMQYVVLNQDNEKYKEDGDALSVFAYNHLLDQANDFGMQVEYLEDLTREQRDYILEPYLEASRSKQGKYKKRDRVEEDFAGVLSGGPTKTVSEGADSVETTDSNATDVDVAEVKTGADVELVGAEIVASADPVDSGEADPEPADSEEADREPVDSGETDLDETSTTETSTTEATTTEAATTEATSTQGAPEQDAIGLEHTQIDSDLADKETSGTTVAVNASESIETIGSKAVTNETETKADFDDNTHDTKEALDLD